MKLQLVPLFLLIAVYTCGQQPTTRKANPAIVEINKQMMALVAHIKNPDSSKKAIVLLDQATAIDSTNFLAHYNKLMFFTQLRQYDRAIATVNKLIQLRPFAHDLYLTGGGFYERVGDTAAAKVYFTKSLAICNSVLDTMRVTNSDYEMYVMNRATNLIMLGDATKANELLKALYDKQTDEAGRVMVMSLINKTKKELLGL